MNFLTTPLVGEWSPFSFFLVFLQKNVALYAIWVVNQLMKRLFDVYLLGLLVFEYNKLTDQVILSSYAREQAEMD